MDRFIGKVILVNLPNTKRPRYRWIVRRRDDGRYIVTTPNPFVKIRDLYKRRANDFGDETILPQKSTPLLPLIKTKKNEIIRQKK
jgi:hypothetical protein